MTGDPLILYDPTLPARARARARMSLERALATSPVRLLGKDALRQLAGDLDKRRAPDKPPVTPSRLALKLRSSSWFASNVVFATRKTRRDLGDADDTGDGPPRPPNAATKKAAMRKLEQARNTLDKALAHLTADAVLAFDAPDIRAVALLRREIKRLEGNIEVPLDLRRGSPVLAMLIAGLHETVFDLTGGWQRSWGDAASPDDRFITDWLHRVTRALMPENVSDNQIGMCIETAIRKPKLQPPR